MVAKRKSRRDRLAREVDKRYEYKIAADGSEASTSDSIRAANDGGVSCAKVRLARNADGALRSLHPGKPCATGVHTT